MKITKEILQFIQEHAEDNIHQLALNSERYPEIDMHFALQQIAGGQIIKNKIPTFYNFKSILYPPKISLEQTSSEATARYKAKLCSGKSFVDLTGGFGCDCFFISQNFEKSVFIEQNSELCEIAGNNFRELKAKNIDVKCSQAEDYLNKIEEKVDLIYLDPARRSITGTKTVLITDCTPNVSLLIDKLLAKSTLTLLKLSPLIDILAVVKELKYVCEVHVVAVENECKETLFLLENKRTESVNVTAVNLLKNAESQFFSFEINDESMAKAHLATNLQKFLFEPNSAILKAGAFKFLTVIFKIDKLDINTHLYTSENNIDNFPGRIFIIEETVTFNNQNIKKLKLKYPKANITVRNFPLNVHELRLKTGIKEGGDVYIFACRFKSEKKLIFCRKA